MFQSVNNFELKNKNDLYANYSYQIFKFTIDSELISLIQLTKLKFPNFQNKRFKLAIYPNLNKFNFNSQYFNQILKQFKLINLETINPLNSKEFEWEDKSIHKFNKLKSILISYDLIDNNLIINEVYISEKFNSKLDSILNLLGYHYLSAYHKLYTLEINYRLIIEEIDRAIIQNSININKYLDDKSYLRFINGLKQLLY